MGTTIKTTPHFNRQRLPAWFRQELPRGGAYAGATHTKELMRISQVSTVCEEARCPNKHTCWGHGVATLMILGKRCTRACRFCAVESGYPMAVDPLEPERVADVVAALQMTYVVITSVTRDDLSDGGAEQFAQTVMHIRKKTPGTIIELLIPDFLGNRSSLRTVIDAHPDVIGHNMETVARLYSRVRPQADYARSLAVLDTVRGYDQTIIIKSGFMVGLGETADEVIGLMADIRATGSAVLTIGQYLAPGQSARFVPVERFVHPEEFESYARAAHAVGFSSVHSGPLVRSSYRAEEGFRQAQQEAV